MAIWKDSNGRLHDDNNGEALNLPSWPQGMTKLTNAQAAALQNPAPTLAQAQANACIAIDAAAGAARAKYITTVAGQSETYISKATDAAAYKAAGYPFVSLANYPWVQAEAQAINGATPTALQAQAAADGILAAQAAWIAKGAQIEQARRAGAVAVNAATTVTAIQVAQNNTISALQLL